MATEIKNVVWQHRKNGTRFMTSYTEGEVYKDTEHHLVIGENLSDDDALVLCKVTEGKNIDNFLDGLPEELRSPQMDAIIANMIKTGK